MPKMTERWRELAERSPFLSDTTWIEERADMQAELSRAVELAEELEAVLKRLKKARRFDDEGRYCGWRISGPASVNEAMVFVDAALARLNEEEG